MHVALFTQKLIPAIILGIEFPVDWLSLLLLMEKASGFNHFSKRKINVNHELAKEKIKQLASQPLIFVLHLFCFLEFPPLCFCEKISEPASFRLALLYDNGRLLLFLVYFRMTTLPHVRFKERGCKTNSMKKKCFL